MNDHLRGVRNGGRTGMKLNIVVIAVERINEEYQHTISASTI